MTADTKQYALISSPGTQLPESAPKEHTPTWTGEFNILERLLEQPHPSIWQTVFKGKWFSGEDGLIGFQLLPGWEARDISGSIVTVGRHGDFTDCVSADGEGVMSAQKVLRDEAGASLFLDGTVPAATSDSLLYDQALIPEFRFRLIPVERPCELQKTALELSAGDQWWSAS